MGKSSASSASNATRTKRRARQKRDEKAESYARLNDLTRTLKASRKKRLAERKAKVARAHGHSRVADALEQSANDPSVTFAPFGNKFRSKRDDLQAAIDASDEMLRKIEEVGVDDSHLVQLHSVDVDWGDMSETTTSEFGVSAISKGLREAREKVAKKRREARRRRRREEAEGVANDSDEGVDARPKSRRTVVGLRTPMLPPSPTSRTRFATGW